MNTKPILASLAAGIASFFIGWLVWGILLMDYYEASMNQFEGLNKAPEDMNMMAMILANLVMGLLIGWSLWRMGITKPMSGAVAGAVLFTLVSLSMSLYYISMTNMYKDNTIVIVDMAVNAIVGGILGAIAAMVLGRGDKASA